MYKGNFWSRMTGRTESRPFLTPGPGDYEHETKMTATQVHNEAVREAKRMSSWQPRFLDTLYRNKIREVTDSRNTFPEISNDSQCSKRTFVCRISQLRTATT